MKIETSSPDQDAKLVRTLNLSDMTLLVIGSIIGSGIFFVPSAIVAQLGQDTGLVLLAWLAGGVLSFIGALSLAELTVMKPEAGGIYVFIRDSFGSLPAFLYGWTLFFVVSSGTVATLAVAFGDNLRRIVPLSTVGTKATAMGLIAALTALNVRGTRQSASVQNVVTALKMVSILAISGVILAKAHATLGARTFLPRRLSWSAGSSFGVALVSVLWAYEGWQYASYTAGESRDPRRNFPRAFFAGIATVMVLYLAANIAYLAALGPSGVASSHNVAADAVTVTTGRSAATLVVIVIALSVFGGVNAVLLTNPRVYFAMAKDGVFFSKLAKVHPRFHTPAFAILVSSGWAGVLVVSGTFKELLTYVIFTGWLFYGLAVACVFVYRRRFPTVQRGYGVPGYPWTPVLFLMAAAGLAVNTLFRQPRSSLAGLAIVALGVPAYRIWSGGFSDGKGHVVATSSLSPKDASDRSLNSPQHGSFTDL
jgi:basic amino acid/polyamine antiporter, APA family